MASGTSINLSYGPTSGSYSGLSSGSFSRYSGNGGYYSPGGAPSSSGVSFGFDWSSLANSVNNLINTGSNLAGAYVNNTFNKEQFEYQKELQERLIQMELNAMQNKVNDYTAAGFSPLAALEGTAGNQIGAVANTASYQNVGDLIANAGAALAANSFNSQRLSLDKQIAADNTRIEELKVSTSRYIADMQNDSKLKELYLKNQQFYDSLEQAQKQFEAQLGQAKTLAEQELAARKYIAQCDRSMQFQIAKMQDRTRKKELTQQWNQMVAQMKYEASEAVKQRNWQSRENAWNRVTSLGTSAMNSFTTFMTFGK